MEILYIVYHQIIWKAKNINLLFGYMIKNVGNTRTNI